MDLTAKTELQQIVLDYLTSEASPELMEKIQNGTKGLDDMEHYIIKEMRKKQQKGVAYCTDKTLFGMAVHYFEEDSIKKEASSGGNYSVSKVTKPSVNKPQENKKAQAKAAAVLNTGQIEGQLSLFGGM